MRYIGNKENVIETIFSILQANNVSGNSFFDFFSGTTNVARFYKEKGYKVYSSDVLYMSYCLQKAYIENNTSPNFSKLCQLLPTISPSKLFMSPLDLVVEYLNGLVPEKGFIYKNYTPEGTINLQQPRMYFSSENGAKIDAIRLKIEQWKNEDLLTEIEYYILITCLIETVSFYANVSGVYAAFNKKWDPRAVKKLELRTIRLCSNFHQNIVYNEDSMSLLNQVDVDILYLDPPYNERQYLPNYHVLETIAKYDNPEIKGVTGMRGYENKKSSFCNAKSAIRDLEEIVKKAKFNHLVLSYNSEGIMKQEDILNTFSRYGTVKLEQFEYMRFKSNNNGLSRTKKNIFEQVYILSK